MRLCTNLPHSHVTAAKLVSVRCWADQLLGKYSEVTHVRICHFLHCFQARPPHQQKMI